MCSNLANPMYLGINLSMSVKKSLYKGTNKQKCSLNVYGEAHISLQEVAWNSCRWPEASRRQNTCNLLQRNMQQWMQNQTHWTYSYQTRMSKSSYMCHLNRMRMALTSSTATQRHLQPFWATLEQEKSSQVTKESPLWRWHAKRSTLASMNYQKNSVTHAAMTRRSSSLPMRRVTETVSFPWRFPLIKVSTCQICLMVLAK